MIKDPKKFNQFKPAGFDNVFNWDFLLPAFEGTNIQPMDIDAIIERNGRFIIFETKDEGVKIPKGQQITLERLVLLGKGKIHLMVLNGKSHKDISAVEEWYYNKGKCEINKSLGDADYVLDRVTKWFKWANSLKGKYEVLPRWIG